MATVTARGLRQQLSQSLSQVYGLLALGGLLLSLATPAAAHLMVAQHGTLNRVADGVFMVLSLPVAAFSATDDDGDGRLSAAEFAQHRQALSAAVHAHIRLLDRSGPRPLDGLLLSPVTPHDQPNAPAEQLVVMGRFVLAADTAAADLMDLRFEVSLFSAQTDTPARSLTLTATDNANALQHKQVLTPLDNSMPLFAPPTSVVGE